ncbi:hypothetical protein QBC43DRAFT_322952 [Cladorrhinum sp. PSN259]|nr:hypothetical protein QBC43DRAFT_322952 [Cladorrhinum sp. PSN259]
MPSSLGASCPSGGSFYVCENAKTEFIGCCTSDPCTTANGGSCPKANIRPASFSIDSYHEIPAQQCDSSESTALWYTCAENKPPFMGCCKSNPCSSGSCKPNDFVAARLSSNKNDRQAFLGEARTSTLSTTTSSATETSSTTSESATSTSSSDSSLGSQAPQDTSPKSGKLSEGGMIGIGVGAGVLVIVLGILAFFFIKHRRNARHRGPREDQITAFVTGGRGAEYKPVSSFSTPEPSHTRPHLPPSHLPTYSATTPSHLSPQPSTLNMPYDPHRETKMRAISQISEVSQVSDRTTSSYAAYQPSSIGESPNLADLSSNATGRFSGQIYSDLPVEGRQKPGHYQELSG